MPTADELLGAAEVRALIRCLTRTDPQPRLPTVRRTLTGLADQALAQRVRAVSDALLADLPPDYPAFAAVVDEALFDPAFTGWLIWPVSEAVAQRAVASEVEFEAGLDLLARLTPRLTGEFAIRTFLRHDLGRTLTVVAGWTSHPDEHVRRLASEGTRSRLPWARRVPELTARPGATVAILDALHRDDAEYVRRSVANHLNDISRADPGLAVSTARRWLEDPDVHTAGVLRRALRTLVKAGDPDALALLGFGSADEVAVVGPDLETAAIPMGGDLRFGITISNLGADPATLAVDYVVHHRKANGTLAPKVFKLATRTLAPGASDSLTRAHSFRPISTRTYYPGEHAIELQVNGIRHGRVTFDLG